MILPVLPLQDLSSRHQGLTRALAESYLEAARVSLALHHQPPQQFTVQQQAQPLPPALTVVLTWEPPDARCYAAWANQDDATRDGAYPCAIVTLELLVGLYAIRRAETLTGADYYVAPLGHTGDNLAGCYRLEVSGTHADMPGVRQRLREKARQARQGKSNLPAWAVVVGFRVKYIAMQLVEGAL